MLGRAAAALIALIALAPTATTATQCADLALVLALDTSGSVDAREYALQTKGLAHALRDPQVAAAIKGAGAVAMAAVFWGDDGYPIQTIPWTTLTGAEEIDRFAALIETNPRQIAGGTDLGSGVWAALDLLDGEARCASRRLVNVTGDGRETVTPRRRHGFSVMAAKDRAKSMGVTVNALAISNEESDLAAYYERQLITGDGAFVMNVSDYAGFSRAMRNKLVQEIEPPVIAGTGYGPDLAMVDMARSDPEL